MALLEMINSVRGKLRQERIGAIATADLLTTEIIDLINDAGSEILEGEDWEFDVRHDGRMWFPASQSGTNGLFGLALTDEFYENANTISLNFSGDDGAGEVFEDVDAAGFRMSGSRLRTRITSSGIPFANTSWIISNVDLRTTHFRLTLGSNLTFDHPIDVVAWTTYSNEYVLPSTVKRVLSVRNEEHPLQLEFIESDLTFDRSVPRPQMTFGIPEIVRIGGTITSTARTQTSPAAWPTISTASAVTGNGVMIWPIPDADTHLEYSYIVQHSDLSAATDEWTGVPSNIIHLIEWRAFHLALLSGIQNDPNAAALAERQVERRMARAKMRQSRQPYRRMIPASFGMRTSYPSRARWASQTISVS